MIPAIGYMVGFYILTKMFELLGKKEAGKTEKAFGLITILVTMFSLLMLFMKGFTTPAL